MSGVLIRGVSALLALSAIACGDSDGSGMGGAAGAGGASGTGFSASVVFANVLVGDGIESTNIDVTVEDAASDTDVAYQGTGVSLSLELPAQTSDLAAEVRASSDQRVLVSDSPISLVVGRSYTVYVVGELAAVEGAFAPTLVTLENLGPPESGSFRIRGIHATPGFGAAVDVYANGSTFSDLEYGSASESIEAGVGAPETDSLVVTEAGVPPDEATDLFRAVGQTLFEDGGRYDLVVSRTRSGLNGDINGTVTVWIAEESD